MTGNCTWSSQRFATENCPSDSRTHAPTSKACICRISRRCQYLKSTCEQLATRPLHYSASWHTRHAGHALRQKAWLWRHRWRYWHALRQKTWSGCRDEALRCSISPARVAQPLRPCRRGRSRRLFADLAMPKCILLKITCCHEMWVIHFCDYLAC